MYPTHIPLFISSFVHYPLHAFTVKFSGMFSGMFNQGSNIYQLSSIYAFVSMVTEFFIWHGIGERKNIILNKLRSRISQYILHK